MFMSSKNYLFIFTLFHESLCSKKITFLFANTNIKFVKIEHLLETDIHELHYESHHKEKRLHSLQVQMG